MWMRVRELLDIVLWVAEQFCNHQWMRDPDLGTLDYLHSAHLQKIRHYYGAIDLQSIYHR